MEMYHKKLKPVSSNRRGFITDCLKLSLGVTLIGLKLDSLGNVNDSYLDYTICISQCKIPCVYNAACKGCRMDNTLVCDVKKCCIAKGLPSCAHCTLLRNCQKGLWVSYPASRTRALQKQNEWGLTNLKNINENQDSFKVFPNVTHDKVTIENLKQLDVKYRLIDINGQCVSEGDLNSRKNTLDFSDQTPGHYFLNIIRKNELLHVSKILKQ